MTAAGVAARAPPAELADYEVSCVASFEALQANERPLREAEAAADFYSTWTWFTNLSRHGIEPAFERRLLTVRDRRDGSLLCLPLLERKRGEAAVFGPVTSSLSNYYSSLYGPLGDETKLTPAALRAAVAYLRRRVGCAVIDLHPLDTESRFFAAITEALRAEGYVVDSYLCFGNWHLEVGGRSFAVYEPTIPSRLRNTIKRGRKKLDAAGAWDLQVHTEPGPALEQAIADFETIYSKSWKTPEPFPQFVPGLCRAAAANGWLRLGVLRFEQRPIAAQLWIVKHGRALIYKLAYDEDYKRFSAGSVLSAELMRRAIDVDRVVDVDYLTGDDAYKVDWMSHRRERRGIVAFDPWRPAGLLSLLRHRLGAWWRRRRGNNPLPAAPAPPDDAEVAAAAAER